MFADSRQGQHPCFHSKLLGANLPSVRRLWSLWVTLLGLSGCGDEIIGYITSTSAQSTDAGESSGNLTSASSGDATGGMSTGESAEPWGGGCYSDDFDQPVLDGEVWSSWAEPGAGWVLEDGVLRFTPTPTGLGYTGIVGSWRYRFPFDDAEISVEVAKPPTDGAPLNVYLQLLEEPYVLSVRYGVGVVSVSISDGNGPGGGENFASPQPPRSMRIRGEGDVVHFETSMDGQTWTTLTTRPQPAVLTSARPLVMVETVDDYPEQLPVEIERFDACARF